MSPTCPECKRPLVFFANEPAAACCLRAQLADATRERDAYRKAKQENDERFIRERDEARAEVERLRGLLDEATTLLDDLQSTSVDDGDTLAFDKAAQRARDWFDAHPRIVDESEFRRTKPGKETGNG